MKKHRHIIEFGQHGEDWKVTFTWDPHDGPEVETIEVLRETDRDNQWHDITDQYPEDFWELPMWLIERIMETSERIDE